MPDSESFYPFAIGQRYRTKAAFSKGSSQFQADDVLVFKGGGYGPYDDAHVYNFTQVRDGLEIKWWLWSGESKDLWRSFFEEIPNP